MSYFERFSLMTATGSVVNPSTEDTLQLIYNLSQNTDTTIQLLKRIAKILEPISTQTSQQVQHVNLLNNTATLTSVPSGNINTPVTSGGQAPSNGSGTTFWQATWPGPVDPRWTNLEQARISYNTGIRSNLNFT